MPTAELRADEIIILSICSFIALRLTLQIPLGFIALRLTLQIPLSAKNANHAVAN